MDLHAGPYTFKTLLSSKKIFSVPRYQREFSWGNQELTEMYNDIIKRLKVNDDGTLTTTEYFFGNIILQGDMTNNSVKEMSIIDGQQRLTAVTIFLAALSNRFKDQKQDDLYNGARQYILAVDDDNKQFPILVNKTPAPFFQYKIQGMKEDAIPITDEEEKIEKAYKLFYSKLSKNTLLKRIKELYEVECNYIDALKVVRDQLLGSYVISCWTTNSEYVNLVFEIMNAKGLELASIDLIKNEIFAMLDETVPADYASEEWKSINSNLLNGGTRVPFTTFFRHYWSSRYGRVSDDKLFTSFKKNIKNKEDCKMLLSDMSSASKNYMKIVSPQLSDYDNKNQYLHLVETLNNINNVFYVNMPRILLLVLFEKYNQKIIDTKLYENTLKFIERFHFAYNGIFSLRTNKLEQAYCITAQSLNKSDSLEECRSLIDDFKKKLIQYLPSKEHFVEATIKLKYSSKEKLSTNHLCKYLLQEIEKEKANIKYNRQDSSIEHIFGDDVSDEGKLLVSRLILLQRDENSRIPASRKPLEKYIDYQESVYAYPKYISTKINHCTSDKEMMEILDNEFTLIIKSFYDKLTN